MQIKKEQLERQQEILKLLGFYQGKVDGIWGPRSIDAKKKFEASNSFAPGIPKNGMPFADFGPYPANITIDHATNMLQHPRLSEQKEEVKVEVKPEPTPPAMKTAVEKDAAVAAVASSATVSVAETTKK